MSKPKIDVGDPQLALTLAVALQKIGLIDVGGAVVSFAEESAGVAVITAAPVGFTTDSLVTVELTGCGAYDGTWTVITYPNDPARMFLVDAAWQGPHNGGKWEIEEQLDGS